MLYDSKLELSSADYLLSLGFHRVSHFKEDFTFTDKFGDNFRALPDFYNPVTGLYIELKGCKLNSKTGKSKAENAMKRFENSALKFPVSANARRYAQLRHGWNHSKYKQRIVQTALSPLNFVVVFDRAIPSDDYIHYCKLGLHVCTLKSLPSYNGYVHLRKKGLAVSFEMVFTAQ